MIEQKKILCSIKKAIKKATINIKKDDWLNTGKFDYYNSNISFNFKLFLSKR